jgi:hypothetical protein
MRISDVAPALRDRLGHDGTVGLLVLVESERFERDERVLSIAVERFERRLAEEVGGLRVALVREIQETRTEGVKWAFVFWIGQLAAFVALLAFVSRGGGH